MQNTIETAVEYYINNMHLPSHIKLERFRKDVRCAIDEGFDLEKEYQLIQEKKSKYSSNDRRIILNMYNNRIGDVI